MLQILLISILLCQLDGGNQGDDLVKFDFSPNRNITFLLFDKNGHDLLVYDCPNLLRVDSSTGKIKQNLIATSRKTRDDSLAFLFNDTESRFILINPFIIESIDSNVFEIKTQKKINAFMDLSKAFNGLCYKNRYFLTLGKRQFDFSGQRVLSVWDSTSLKATWSLVLPDAESYSPILAGSAKTPLIAVANGHYCGIDQNSDDKHYVEKLGKFETKVLVEKMVRENPEFISSISDIKNIDFNEFSIYRSSQKQLIRFYEIGSPKANLQFTGHSGYVAAMDMASDGSYLAVAAENTQSVKIANKNALSSIYDNVYDSKKHSIDIWDVAKKKIAFSLDGHKKMISCIKFSHNNEMLFTYGFSNNIENNTSSLEFFLWDLATKRHCRFGYKGSVKGFSLPAIDFDSKKIAFIDNNKIIVKKMFEK